MIVVLLAELVALLFFLLPRFRTSYSAHDGPTAVMKTEHPSNDPSIKITGIRRSFAQ